jgi:glycosyltransferase involved in cell wall biosynthesis
MGKKIVLSVVNDTYTDQRVHKMAQSLSKMGHLVTIVGRKSKQIISQPEYAKIVRFRMIFKKSFAFYAEYNFKLFFFLLFSKVDILTANDLDTLLPNYLVSKIRKKRLIFDSHELFVESPEIISRKNVQKFWKWIERFCLKGIDAGITVSEPIAEYYTKKCKKDFVVIRNLPYLYHKTVAEVSLPEYFYNENIVLYQGHLNIGRGLEMAIDAFKHIDNACLAIIGVGDIEKELKERVRRLKLENKVFFTGRVSPEIIHEYTVKATLGLSIEQKLGKNYEYALPNKLFDYIHAGVPVIVTDLPEMKKVVEKYKVGEVFKTEIGESTGDVNSSKFAELIKTLISSPEKLTEYKRNCLNAAKELCWENEIEKLPY